MCCLQWVSFFHALQVIALRFTWRSNFLAEEVLHRSMVEQELEEVESITIEHLNIKNTQEECQFFCLFSFTLTLSRQQALVILHGQFIPIFPCSPQSWQYRVSLLPLLLPLLCFQCLISPCHRDNQVCSPWSPSCILSCLRRLFCHSSSHQLLFHDATLPIRSVLSCPCRHCTRSKRSRTRFRMTWPQRAYRHFISCIGTGP